MVNGRPPRAPPRLTDLRASTRKGRDKEGRTGMLALLCRLGDEARTGRFLREVVLSSYSGGENEAQAAALTLIGPKASGSFLPALVEAHFARRTRGTLALLRRLDEEHGGPASSDASWHGALRKGVRAALSALPGALAGRTPEPDPEWGLVRGATRSKTVGDSAMIGAEAHRHFILPALRLRELSPHPELHRLMGRQIRTFDPDSPEIVFRRRIRHTSRMRNETTLGRMAAPLDSDRRPPIA